MTRSLKNYPSILNISSELNFLHKDVFLKLGLAGLLISSTRPLKNRFAQIAQNILRTFQEYFDGRFRIFHKRFPEDSGNK